MIRWFAFIALFAALPATARDSLGVYSGWAAFRDPQTPRCYAIAAPGTGSETSGYASIGTWPKQEVRGQVHIRLSRVPSRSAQVRLMVGAQRFNLTNRDRDAWAEDKAVDAAIVAAMRSAETMTVRATAANGTRFADRYRLEGAATAMDAAVVGCAQL